MGLNLALNIASKGFRISVANRSPNRVDTAVQEAEAQGLSENVVPFKDDLAGFVKSIQKPRAIIILVNAGAAVDSTIQALRVHLEEGDIIIDGGNEWWENTERRSKELAEYGLQYLGMGVSGGEVGARYGPSLMPGGPKAAYLKVEDVMLAISAKSPQGEPCVTYIGPGGSGNYVKMVHNGIEYGDMQLIAEAYDLLKHVGGLSNEELAATFAEWNQSELQSYLIEITSKIFAVKDESKENYVVDVILDKTGMKGTGTWTVRDAAQQGVAVPTIAAALTARQMSALLEERKAASHILKGPQGDVVNGDAESANQILCELVSRGLLPGAVDTGLDRAAFALMVRDALYAAKICSYAQGMALIKATGEANEWDLNLGEIARIWKAGCIIRARFLGDITKAFLRNPLLPNLMVDEFFAHELNARQQSLRALTAAAALLGVSVPAFSSSLAYYDAYRRARLPANLTQAQRDFFGAHTYERVDQPGSFHTEWNK